MDKETLLIVEDNHILCTGLKEMLAIEGFRVLAASNGQEALDLLNETTPDMILSDISMPVMDGFTFFRAVRQRPDWVAIPFIFLTARSEREDIMIGRDLGAEDYLVKPVMREELLKTVRARLTRSQQLRLFQLQQSYQSSLTMLANAIEVRDHYTRGHVERVTAYALVVAEYLGWQELKLERLRYGAILHDIGKIEVRESTLNKRGRLTDEEWAEIKKHPVTGAELIKDIEFLAPSATVVLYHHERWDGKGYPDGLAGEEIPLDARIVAVADGFDAMTTSRPYRITLTLSEAYAEIVACSGSQYDPTVVKAFQRAWEDNRIQNISGSNNHHSPDQLISVSSVV